jgi:uncharacterized protein (TIGR02217 family)
MSERFTTANGTALGSSSRSNDCVTQAYAQVVGDVPNVKRYFTTANVDVHGNTPPANRYFTQLCIQILSTRTPTYEFTNVILSDVFPDDISYNSVGSTRFATDVIVVDSGDDQRIGRWDQPLMEYDVAFGVRTMEQLTALITFFRAMRGRLYAFNYRDHVDYTSSVAVAYEARQAPPITPFDQVIGQGDGQTYQFQLTKTYAASTTSLIRPIVRPEPGTVQIGINGAAYSSWTVDDNTGIVTFSSPLSKTLADPITKGALAAAVATLTGAPGDFTAFKPYVDRQVLLSGFAHNVNNIPLGVAATLVSVAADGSSISVNYPNAYGSVVETVTGVTVSIHPAPPLNAQISAGYRFFVPCRFDTDVLPVTLEDYGIGSSNSVKLIEVRPSAF